jgi:hypothetical protein
VKNLVPEEVSKLNPEEGCKKDFTIVFPENITDEQLNVMFKKDSFFLECFGDVPRLSFTQCKKLTLFCFNGMLDLKGIEGRTELLKLDLLGLALTNRSFFLP